MPEVRPDKRQILQCSPVQLLLLRTDPKQPSPPYKAGANSFARARGSGDAANGNLPQQGAGKTR
ncbi:hypothetical protein GCM10027430_32660 [Lysobacter tyrosinilyticus]